MERRDRQLTENREMRHSKKRQIKWDNNGFTIKENLLGAVS